MAESLFGSSTLPLLEQVVNFTEARHGVLAGNIANLDTPGYRARDLSTEDFNEQLKAAVASQRRQRTAARSEYPSWAAEPEPASPRRASDELATVSQRVKGILRHDDNNTSLEEQVTEISKNQALHNMALSLMRAQFSLLRAAITERA